MEGGGLQVQSPPDASMAFPTCPDLLGGLEKGGLFLRLLGWEQSAALSHVLPPQHAGQLQAYLPCPPRVSQT